MSLGFQCLAQSPRAVDECNRRFYSRFNYPWRPLIFPLIADPKCGVTFLNQEIGAWNGERIPPGARIWVAGCGTNQAIFTALMFPDADVLGTDLSERSLEICRNTAAQLRIGNLRLEVRSLNSKGPEDEFDYILCTGVIHHNADPGKCLANLRRALKRAGILELMVYNHHHRVLTTAYQQALHALFSQTVAADLDARLSLTRKLTTDFPLQNSMGEFLRKLDSAPEAMIADALLQPVEHSYTVESLERLLESAGLEILLPCVNQFDKAAGRLTWNLKFDDEQAACLYEALPDVPRWQVSNLLMVERSPMLWFYVQRKDSAFSRNSEREVCQSFLGTRFERYGTHLNHYVASAETYHLAARPVPHPSPPLPGEDFLRSLVETVEPDLSIREAFRILDVEPAFDVVSRARTHLTTPLFPYLKAVGPAQ